MMLVDLHVLRRSIENLSHQRMGHHATMHQVHNTGEEHLASDTETAACSVGVYVVLMYAVQICYPRILDAD